MSDSEEIKGGRTVTVAYADNVDVGDESAMNWLYSDSNIYLERKFRRFLGHKTNRRA
jgi:hypothetical protein